MQTTVYQRVKMLREYLGYSQREFSELVGLSVMVISKLERGETNPRTSTLRKMYDSTGVSREWLVDGNGELEINSAPEVHASGKLNWKEEAYKNLEKHNNDLKKEIEFYRDLLKAFSSKVQGANFKEAFVSAGILSGKVIEMTPQNIDESVSPIKERLLTA